MSVENYAALANSNQRRREAIKPIVEIGSWKIFDNISTLADCYQGQWVTGEVQHHGYPVDFSVRPKRGSKRLAVIFNSQQNSDGKLKLFTWTKVAERLDASCLHISDPSLYLSEEAVIGWYSCNYAYNFQPVINELIQLFAQKLGTEEFIFLGSSAGGYPAFLHSQLYEKSTALLLAPTLSAADSRHDFAREQYLSLVNNVSSFDDVRLRHSDVLLTAEDILSLNNGKLLGSVNLLQSIHDYEFWRDHTSRLLGSLGYDDEKQSLIELNKFTAIFGDWGSNHNPPPIEVINAAVDSINEIPVGDLNNWRLKSNLSARTD